MAKEQKPLPPEETTEPVSIYQYFNYRKFLQDLYQYKKSVNKNFSYRVFARRAGINSSAIYLLLVKERQNMTPNLLPKFAKGLDLNSIEARYLEYMVGFTHAKTALAKQEYFDKMMALLPESARELTSREKDYYSKWYNVAIRESLSILQIKDDYKVIAQFLNPRIKAVEAKKAIELLASLKLIQLNDQGYWAATDTSLRSTPEIGPLWVRGFQSEMIDMAKKALENIPKTERNISASTFSISRQGFQRIEKKINQFLVEIENIVRSDENESQVYQFNVQLFPLTQKTDPLEKEN